MRTRSRRRSLQISPNKKAFALKATSKAASAHSLRVVLDDISLHMTKLVARANLQRSKHEDADTREARQHEVLPEEENGIASPNNQIRTETSTLRSDLREKASAVIANDGNVSDRRVQRRPPRTLRGSLRDSYLRQLLLDCEPVGDDDDDNIDNSDDEEETPNGSNNKNNKGGSYPSLKQRMLDAVPACDGPPPSRRYDGADLIEGFPLHRKRYS